jgi:hypothetical protein
VTDAKSYDHQQASLISTREEVKPFNAMPFLLFAIEKYLDPNSRKTHKMRGLPSMVKGVGLRLLSCRGSWVQIPPPAPLLLDFTFRMTLSLDLFMLKPLFSQNFSPLLPKRRNQKGLKFPFSYAFYIHLTIINSRQKSSRLEIHKTRVLYKIFEKTWISMTQKVMKGLFNPSFCQSISNIEMLGRYVSAQKNLLAWRCRYLRYRFP